MAFHVQICIAMSIHDNTKIYLVLIQQTEVAWYTPSQLPSYTK